MQENIGQMRFDAIHSFHDTIQMWFDNIQILIQNPHDALNFQQKSNDKNGWTAWVVFVIGQLIGGGLV